MDIYEIIQSVSDMLGININQPPIVYEDETKEYCYDKLKINIKHQIIKDNDKFIYLLHAKELGKYRYDSMILNDTKDVYNVFIRFIRDSYYDSPVKFNNWRRHEEHNDNFLLHYQKHPTYFYMGLYSNNNLDDFYRVYVKRNKEEMYNEYITEEVVF